MRTVRALSSGNLAEYEVMDEFHFKNAPDRPIHRPTQSLFTASSEFTNYRGLFNWGCFLLLITTSRMALENIIKYGIVMDPSAWLRFILSTSDKYFALGLLLCCNLFILVAWSLEHFASRRSIPNAVAMGLSCANLFAVLAFPSLAIWSHDFNPLFSSPVLTVYTVLFLKLWSYVAVNYWCRTSQASSSNREDFLTKLRDEYRAGEQKTTESNKAADHEDQGTSAEGSDKQATVVAPTVRHRFAGKDGSTGHRHRTESPRPTAPHMSARDRFRATRMSTSHVEPYHAMLDALDWDQQGVDPSSEGLEFARSRYVTYPNNLTLGDLYYFMFAPTLCYELNFPRTLTIRKTFVLRRVFEIIFINQLILCLSQQWVLPLLKNSVAPIGESNFSQIVERCLKLAIPNHFLWLLFFYSTFHSFLNLLGELTYFGDRFFYNDWWNAETVPTFWSKWNIPVHRFARRHIYIPLINCGLTRPQSGMVVFFISALLHEFLISVPLKMPRMWAFLCMFSQIPYASLVNYLFPHGGALGNVAVWITLIIGQPLAMLFYFHDYYLAHYVT